MLEQVKEISMLYDFYGDLLPEKQREIFRLYHEDNYSLAEIGQEYDITRQGVHEALKRAMEKLAGFEAKLGLVKRFRDTEQALNTVRQEIGALTALYDNDKEFHRALDNMKQAIDGLER
jgi:predicted DNA-binding protein YlxM (UPF0122 family)